MLADVRFGFRMILKTPAVTVVAMLALAIGICANTTIFSFINALLLRPPSGVKDPDRLVAVYTSDFSSGLYGGSSYLDYLDFRSEADAFEGLAAYEQTVLNSTGDNEAERLRGTYVTGNFFSVLGVNASIGRTLQPSDDTPSESNSVVISEGLWRRRLGANPNIIGQPLKLGGRVYTIVGVAPHDFRGLRLGPPPEFWISMGADSNYNSSGRGDRGIEITGRMKTGVDLSQAQAQLQTIAARLAQAYPKTNLGTLSRPNEPRPITVTHESLVEPSARLRVWTVSLLLLAVVTIVLVIACANVANMMLARASARRREIAIRLALGAGRGRLLRQLFTEGLMLALLGSVVGLTASQWTAGALPAFFPADDSSGLELGLDWRVFGFTLALTLLTAVLFALVPALQSTKPDLIYSLKDEQKVAVHHLRRFGLRDVLVVSQVALSLVLVIGAALFVRSLRHSLQLNPGFDSKNLLIASIETSGTGLEKQQGQAFYQQTLERIGSLHGVKGVTLTALVPLSGDGQRRGVMLEGYEPQPKEDTELNTTVVGLNYFATMGIPLVSGRDFASQDRDGAPGVVIVNEDLARRYFSGNAIGRRLRFGSDTGYCEIIGVVRNNKQRTLREEPLPLIYLPFLQQYQPRMTVIARTEGDPLSLITPLRSEMRALNKDVPVFSVQTMTQKIRAQLAADRMIAVLLSVFGVSSMLLASIGIYGVISYSITQRTHEIGIRMTLGAERRDILKLVIGQGALLIAVGAAIGLGLALVFTQLWKNMLFGISATDPFSFVAIPLLLTTVAVVACYIPARRATKVDPLVALRYE